MHSYTTYLFQQSIFLGSLNFSSSCWLTIAPSSGELPATRHGAGLNPLFHWICLKKCWRSMWFLKLVFQSSWFEWTLANLPLNYFVNGWILHDVETKYNQHKYSQKRTITLPVSALAIYLHVSDICLTMLHVFKKFTVTHLTLETASTCTSGEYYKWAGALNDNWNV